MTIPLPLIWGVVQVIHQEASTRSLAATDRLRREDERDRLKEGLAAPDRREERQKEVLLRMLEASTRKQEARLEAIIAMFRDAKTMLENHQTVLAQQKKPPSTAPCSTENSRPKSML